mgnify:CR=1 FL=1
MDSHATTNLHAEETLRELLAPIQELLEDPSIDEIMINSPTEVWIEKRGEKVRTGIVVDNTSLRAAIQTLGRLDNKDVTAGGEHSLVDTRLTGLRVAAGLSPCAVEGNFLCIRKHRTMVLPLQSYGDDQTVEHLREFIRARKNILISGGTSSGKTTFINAMIGEFDKDDRLVILEDTVELVIENPNRLRLCTNEQQKVTMRSLVKLTLRARPDRIVLGEIRGPEAFDLMQAMNTGHDGCMASIHANSAKAALSRLETLVLTANTGWPIEAIRHEIGNTVHGLVHMERGAGGKRRIAEIIAVEGYGPDGYELNVLYDKRKEEGNENLEEPGAAGASIAPRLLGVRSA